ncbi:MAG TPA: hypothetical protein VMA77_05885 [Solirubrobacteraceae bacterium]|nr:hypothetical protein [Solirubrobacteraceae bacterium]
MSRGTAHLQLMIDVDSDPISGSVSNGCRVAQPFTGWIELAAAIEAARTSSHLSGGRQAAGKTLGSLPGANGEPA